jgi:serine/threonine protein kinase
MKFMSDDIKYSGLSGKSVNHCPPEVLKSELRNKDNDVWWLGNVFYYVMYNKLPPCVDKINNEVSYNNNTKEENQIKKLINNMLCVDIKNIINIENVFNTINGIIENYFK